MHNPLNEASTSRKDERAKPVRCVQCGEALEMKALETRTGSKLCRDCAFDSMPCTD